MTRREDVRGFEELWNVFRDPTRITPDLLRSASFRAQLTKLTKSAPPAVVAHVATLRTPSALKANLDYISRGGEIGLEGRDREVLRHPHSVVERARDWSTDRTVFQERMCLAYSFVAAMPRGTPREPVFEAGLAFARAAWGGSTDFLAARHDDEPHPHVHVTFRAQDDEGMQLKPSPSDLQRWRLAFAAALHDHGVEADASPRWARGVVVRSLAHRVHYMQEAHQRDGAAEPRYVDRDIQAALSELERGPDQARPWEPKIKATQQAVRDGYGRIVDQLRRMGAPEDLALAQQVTRFVQAMAPVRTRREQLVDEVRAVRALTFQRSDDLERGR